MSNPAQQLNPPCPKCHCKSTTKRGKRRNRLRTLQLFQCTECLHRFTEHPEKNRPYPHNPPLDPIPTSNLASPTTATRSILRRRFHVDVPDRTINSWLTTYRSVSTYARLRAAGKKLFEHFPP